MKNQVLEDCEILKVFRAIHSLQVFNLVIKSLTNKLILSKIKKILWQKSQFCWLMSPIDSKSMSPISLERWSNKVFSKWYLFLEKLMKVISELFTVESELVILKNKTISLLIECMVDFMWIFEKSGPSLPHLPYSFWDIREQVLEQKVMFKNEKLWKILKLDFEHRQTMCI
jgi:hypothetical protein